MKNIKFVLSEEQTQELKKLWWSVRCNSEESKSSVVTILLARKCAVLTHKQLYMICANLANEQQEVPEWCYELLFPVKEELPCTN
jgi:hypothetical protein